MTEDEEAAFEREHGVAVNAGGSVVVAAWGMGLAILFVTIAFAAFLLSYFYLRLENPVWPPDGITAPAGGTALGAAALVVAGGIAMAAALRRVRAADQRGFLLALAAAVAAMVAGIGLQVADIAPMAVDATSTAYGAIFHTLAGFVFIVAGIAVVMGTMALVWGIRGQYVARRHAAVANVARFWAAAVVVWLVGFGALYLGPVVT